MIENRQATIDPLDRAGIVLRTCTAKEMLEQWEKNGCAQALKEHLENLRDSQCVTGEDLLQLFDYPSRLPTIGSA